MNPAVIVLTALCLISTVLGLILAIAWRDFGRPRHALIWAAGFGVAALQWAGNLAGVLFLPVAIYLPAVTVLVLVSTGLLAAGFRRRAHLPVRAGTFAALGAVALALVIAGCMWGRQPLLTSAPIQAYCAIVLTMGAHSFFARGARPTGAELGVVVMLGAFAAFCVIDAVIAAATPASAGSAFGARPPLYHLVMLFGLPAGFIGTGLSCVFLLATDLAGDLRRLALADPLTGVLNRRGLEQAGAGLIATSRRHDQPLAVAIADLDRFKLVNDRFGHAAGDLALQRFVGCIEEVRRRADLFGRIGGEEFAFVMPNTDAGCALEAMERMRCRIEVMGASHAEGEDPADLTASFGVAVLEAGDRDLDMLLRRADAALYQSKLGGRNRVTIATPTRAGLYEIGAAA